MITNDCESVAAVHARESGAIPSINLIGAGRLGAALGHLWSQAGFLTIQDVLNRSDASAKRAVQAIGAGRPVSSFAQLRRADLHLLGVPDDALGAALLGLVATGVLDDQSLVFHCSGAQSSELLAPARRLGAAVGSAHPVMSFASRSSSLSNLKGVGCAIEGDARAQEILQRLFGRSGATCFTVTADQKLVYHAAAVLGSNYVVTLLGAALDAYALAGVDGATSRLILERLVVQTIQNVFDTDPSTALTGPIARGDIELVRREHLALGHVNAGLAKIYQDMAGPTASLARRENPLSRVDVPLEGGPHTGR